MPDLTNEEVNILKDLIDPDTVNNKSTYNYDEEIQKEIIGLLVSDRFFTLQSAGLIKPDYFTNECHKLVSRIVFNYFEKYKQLPSKRQVVEELKIATTNREDKYKILYLGELNSVYEYYIPGVDTREYYLDKITNFAKIMALREAFSTSLDDIKKAPTDEKIWGDIEKRLQNAINVQRNVHDIGLDYFNTYEERYDRKKIILETGDVFVTGFDGVDEGLSMGGLARGELGAVTAPPGTGKSIMLANMTKANLDRGKIVLYISLEIDKDKCADRFDALFANPSPFSHNNGIGIKNLHENKETVFDALREYVSDKDDKRLLLIKQFPMGQMSISDFKAYHSQVCMLDFHPDLIIIDYVGEIKDYPGYQTWESKQRIIRDLKGYAVESKVCILTALQPEGRAKEVVKLGGVIDDENLADAKGQSRPLDALWSINQLKEERECNLARLYVAKHRDGKAKYEVHVEFDYNTLKMQQISQTKYDNILKNYKHNREIIAAKGVQESDADKVNKITGDGFGEKYDHMEVE